MAEWRNPEFNGLTGPDAEQLRRIFESLSVAVQPLDGIPIGTILEFGGTTVPTGYVWAAGQAISRVTYAELFAAFGTTYGAGDGSTTFNVVDRRGRVGVSLDNLGGSDAGRLAAANTLGGSGGAETHTLASSEMPAHTHGAPGNGFVYDRNNSGIINFNTNATAPLTKDVTAATQSTGGGNAHNNMQPYILLNHIIKAL